MNQDTNEEEDKKEILFQKTLVLSNYLDNENSEKIIDYIQNSLDEYEILNLRFNNDKKSLLIKIIFLETNFKILFNLIKNKLSPQNLNTYINTTDDNGISPLLYASFVGKYDTVILLIENGSKVDMRNFMGLSVMHMAAQGDNPNMLIFFKEKYKFSINDRDYAGNTPLHWACHIGSENVINFLICWINDINILNKKGQTPFHFAIRVLRPKIIKKLLRKGADIYLKDFSGKSAMDILNDPNPEVQQREKNFKHVLRVIHNNEPFKLCVYPNEMENKEKNYKELLNGFNDELKEKLIDNNNNSNNENCNYVKNNSLSSVHKILNSLLFFGLHIFFGVLIYFFLLPQAPNILLKYFFFLLIILLVISFINVNLSNPGFLEPKDNLTWIEMVEKKININEYCPYCRVKKEKKVKHCHVCCKCIAGFDHHCNWIDNCVGDKNIIDFLVFVSVILCNLIFSFYLAVNSLLNTRQEDYLNFKIKEKNIFLKSLNTLLNMRWLFKYDISDLIAIVIIIVSCFFFMPVFYVLWIQIRNRVLNK